MLCSCSYESQMIDGGNAVIERIDSYNIGIAIVDENNPPYYYQRIDSLHYTLSFSNGVGESKIYYSDSRKWEDFPRPIKID